MYFNKEISLILSICVSFVFCVPVSQPVYQTSSSPQYAQQLVQYRTVAAAPPQEGLIHYTGVPAAKPATPVQEPSSDREQYRYVASTRPQQYPRTSVDRQVQRVASLQQTLGAYQTSQPSYQTSQPSAQTQYRVVQAGPAPAPQPQAYVRVPVPQAGPQRVAYKPQQSEEIENPEDYDHNPSYAFGFDVKDDEFTNYQNRKEQREGDKITGSYSVVDADGFIRTVTYTADPKEGFKAEVSRQPTDIQIKFPTPTPQTLQQRPHQPQQYITASNPAAQIPTQQKQQRIIYQYQQ